MNRQGRPARMTWLVARRELRQRAKTRAFAISTVVLVIAVALGVALPAILSRNAKPERIGYVGGNAATTTGIIAEAGRLAGVKTVAVPQPSVAAAEAALRSGDLSAVLVGDTEVLVKQVPLGGVSGGLATLAQVAGLSKLVETVPGAAAAVAHGIALPVRGLEPPSKPLSSRLTGLFTVILVWVMISVYGSQIALGIGEEKGSRIAEVLLSSLRPIQLLVGKVTGIGLLALAQAAAMVIAFVVAGFASGSDLVHGAAIGIVLTGGVFVVLGYAFYCTAFAAAGSLVSRQSDVNSTILPVQLPLIIAYILSYTVIYANSANVFYHVLGFFPPTAPIAMPVLYASGDVPLWQVVVVRGAAGRVHRVDGPRRRRHLRPVYPAHRRPRQAARGSLALMRTVFGRTACAKAGEGPGLGRLGRGDHPSADFASASMLAVSAFSSLASTFLALFISRSIFAPMSDTATTTRPACPASRCSPSSFRSLRLIPAAAWPATAPRTAPPPAVTASRPPPIAANGNRTTTRPVARPTPPPSTPPTRVGVSCFLVILTFPSARRSTTAAS